MDGLRYLLLNCSYDIRIAMPERLNAPSCCKEIKIFFSCDIPNPDTFPFFERDGRFCIRRHDVLFVQLDDLLLVHTDFLLPFLTISVPMPLSVNISSRMPCGMPASMMCVFFTPFLSALVHAFSFAIMPPDTIPLCTNVSISSSVTRAMREWLSFTSFMMPTTLVRSTSLMAHIAPATSAATWSELMLYAWPSFAPTPTGGMTGIMSPTSIFWMTSL